jgi:hypothetical protein
MVGQLSLFPPETLPEDEYPATITESNPVDGMFAAAGRFRSSREYMNLLRFIGRTTGYSALNGLLLYLQNPDISHVATAAAWYRRFGRKLTFTARPLFILAPMAPVRFVYDLADTDGGPLSAAQLNPQPVSGGRLHELHANTVINSGLHGIAVREADRSQRPGPGVIPLTFDSRQRFERFALGDNDKYLVVLDNSLRAGEKYASLVCQLAHVYGGHLGIDDQAWWPDRRGVGRLPAEIEADSVAFLACRRLGLVDASRNFLLDYHYRDREVPRFSLNAVFQAFGYIEEMGRSQWKEPRKAGRY